MRVSLILVVLLLLGCQQITPEPYSSPNITNQDPDLRPDIPRSYVPDPSVIDHEQQNDTPFLKPDVVPPYLSLELPIGELMGHAYPFITSKHFPLLRHYAVPLSGSAYVVYDEELLFDFDENTTGMIIFGEDEDEEIGTFLFYENEKPIFTYSVSLRGLAWEDLSGREIELLGNRYVIAEATNTSVSFYGITVASNLFFSDGKKLVVDSQHQLDTRVDVTYDRIAFTVYADGRRDDGNIMLSPGERLTDNMRGFANSVFDIMYEGVTEGTSSHFRLDRTKHGYDMIFDTPDGRIEIPLLEEDAGNLVLGRLDEPLRLDECVRSECITRGETMLFTTLDGRTFEATYTDISEQPPELIVRQTGNRYTYQILGNLTRGNAYTDIVLGDIPFRTEIGTFDFENENANISVDFKRYRDRDVDALLLGGFELDIGTIVDNTLTLEIIIPREYLHEYRRKDESLFITITYEDDFVISVTGNITFVEDDDDRDSFGLTPYGATLFLDSEHENLEENEAIELDIHLPYEQTLGVVRLEG